MNRKNPLITGTIILTITGLVSRFIGFFYRIFLSRTFGAEGMGIYQLTSPVLALSFSLTVSGMQTAISKYVASEVTTQDYKSSAKNLLVGFFMSMFLSICCTLGIYHYADYIAIHLLLEPRTAPLLRIISLSIPMATVHSCINGYFYGVRKTAVPAISQLAEQIVRVGSVYLIYHYCLGKGMEPTISFAVLGLVIGESAAMLVSIIAIRHRFYNLSKHNRSLSNVVTHNFRYERQNYYLTAKNLLSLAAPLSFNRIIINFLQSAEAIFIPNKLMASGLSNASALSVYGILSGMSLPLILFPSAITNSICVLLLPVVSEADASDNTSAIKKAVQQSIQYGFLLGLICTGFFLLFGKSLGLLLYNNELAGKFIIILSFLCPLMYIASTLNSILNGLGKTGLTFLYSILSLMVRLAFVFFVIPLAGINGYLWGMLLSQLVQTLLCIFSVRKYLS